MIPVTKPFIPDSKKFLKYVQKANSKEWLTNFGPLHEELTERLEEWLGVKNLLLVSNGTIALQIAYRALELKEDVLTTPFSFVATSSTLLWEKLRPVYVDIEPESLNLDPKKLPSKCPSNVSAVLAVHVYGNPAETKALDRYCKENKLKMIYDGAHAFGVKKNGKSILTAGDATTLSFHATKVFHTVEGGAIIFKNKSDMIAAKELINFGLDSSKTIKGVGINGKLNEYQAAVGLVLLDEIEDIIERRKALFERYYAKLDDHFELVKWDEDATLNGAYAPILFKSEKELLRVSSKLLKKGIQTRRYFYPSLNRIEEFSLKTKACPVSEDRAKRILCIPLYTSMTKKEQNHVISELVKAL